MNCFIQKVDFLNLVMYKGLGYLPWLRAFVIIFSVGTISVQLMLPMASGTKFDWIWVQPL